MTPTTDCWRCCVPLTLGAKRAARQLSAQVRTGRDVAARWIRLGEVSPQCNYWNLYRDIAWYGVISAVTSTFTSVYVLRLGGSNLLVGLLTSLPALINVLVQIPAARLIEQQRNARRLLLWTGLWMRLPALLLALAPLLLARWRAAGVVWITALGTVPAAASNVAFTAMLADVVPAQDRAHVVSVRNVLFAAVTTLSVIAAGKAMDVLPFPLSYQFIFGLAFVTSLMSLYYLGRVVIPDRQLPAHAAGRGAPGWIQALRAAWSHRGYTRFTLALFLIHWTQYFPLPLYTIYRVRVLNISEGWIGLLSMIESAVTILTWYVWGRVAQRRGSRYVLILGVLGLCYYPLGTALATTAWPLVLVAVLAGIAGPAFSLGMLNGLLELAPETHRPMYVGLFNMLINVPACISPLLGTAVAGWLGVRTALFIAAGMRLAGFLAMSLILGVPGAQQRLPSAHAR